MFQEQNDINNDNDDDDMDAPSKLTLEDLKDNLEELARLYEAGGVEEVLNKEAYGYFIEFIVTFGPKCPPEQLSTTAVKKVDTGHCNVIETIGQGKNVVGYVHFRTILRLTILIYNKFQARWVLACSTF